MSHEAQRKNLDGFRAYIELVSDAAFDRATPGARKAAVRANHNGTSELFVADRTTLISPDHPILVLDLLRGDERPPFRCIASELCGIDNNLNIANMDREEFASATDEGGVFRGFRE